MKKFFFLGAIAALAVIGCQKSGTDEPAQPVKNLVYEGKTKVSIQEGTNFYSIKFTANADWKIEVACDDNTEELTVVAVDKTSGTAGEQTVKVSLEDLLEGQTGRLSMVAISTNNFADDSADNNVQVYFMQGKVFALALIDEDNTVGVEGGTVTYKIIYNSENVKCDHIDCDWATSQWNGETEEVILTAKANTGYDPRSASAVFRTADILVDSVSTETWESTGIKVPAKFYASINQEGNMVEEWRTEFDESIALQATHSIAKFGDKVYVANTLAPTSLFVYNSETGASEGTLDISGINNQAIKGITLDDAGNLVMAFGGAYAEGTFDIYRVKAGKDVKAANAEQLVSVMNSIYGYGLDHIKATGDVTGSAVLSAVCATPTGEGDGTAYCASWQITGGNATSQDYTCTELCPAADIWYSGDLISVPASSDINGGMYYMGYDSHYDICYKSSLTADWEHIYNAAVTWWGENLCGMDVVEWNSGKYMVIDANTFFTEWGMASYISLLDLKNPAEPKMLSCTEHYINGGIVIGSTDEPNERTADVCAVVEDGDLAVYVVDGGSSFVKKLVYSVL